MRILRWILILPAAIAAWYVALFAGIALYLGLNSLCSPDRFVSGLCSAPWYVSASGALVAFGAALAAALILVTSTLLAPDYKRQIAFATFIVGALVAICMGLATQAYAAMASAILVGAAVLAVIIRRLASRRRSSRFSS